MGTQKIMINGLPGNVAKMLIRHAVSDKRFEIIPYSLTGPEIPEKTFVHDGLEIELIGPDRRETAAEKFTDGVIAIDFTHPAAVNDNARFYCRHRIPFVMGTTGGDRDTLAATVGQSGICAVIAPNMAKQIVGLQAMIAHAAENFPGLFSGYRLEVTESHQQGKADTSGTAKAIVGYFNRLGIDFGEEEIERVRDPEIQRNQLGVPEEHIGGHGWHTYTLVSPDRTAKFQFVHNINGRDIYAQGTFDAVSFLAGKLAEGTTGRVFSMIDVLKG